MDTKSKHESTDDRRDQDEAIAIIGTTLLNRQEESRCYLCGESIVFADSPFPETLWFLAFHQHESLARTDGIS